MNAHEAIEAISRLLAELGAREIKTNPTGSFVEFRSAKCERTRYEAWGSEVKIRIFDREFTKGFYVRSFDRESLLWKYIDLESKRLLRGACEAHKH